MQARRTPGVPRSSRPAAPDDDPAAQAAPAELHLLDSRGAPELELPFQWIVTPELADAPAEEAADLVPRRRHHAPRPGQHRVDVDPPERAPGSARYRELEACDRPTRPHDPGELGQGRSGIVDVAKEVRDREGVEGRVFEGKALRARLDELDFGHVLPRDGQHLWALVDTDHGAALLAEQFGGDGAGARGDIEHAVARAGVDARDQEPAPARILAQREH